MGMIFQMIMVPLYLLAVGINGPLAHGNEPETNAYEDTRTRIVTIKPMLPEMIIPQQDIQRHIMDEKSSTLDRLLIGCLYAQWQQAHKTIMLTVHSLAQTTSCLSGQSSCDQTHWSSNYIISYCGSLSILPRLHAGLLQSITLKHIIMVPTQHLTLLLHFRHFQMKSSIDCVEERLIILNIRHREDKLRVCGYRPPFTAVVPKGAVGLWISSETFNPELFVHIKFKAELPVNYRTNSPNISYIDLFMHPGLMPATGTLYPRPTVIMGTQVTYIIYLACPYRTIVLVHVRSLEELDNATDFSITVYDGTHRTMAQSFFRDYEDGSEYVVTAGHLATVWMDLYMYDKHSDIKILSTCYADGASFEDFTYYRHERLSVLKSIDYASHEKGPFSCFISAETGKGRFISLTVTSFPTLDVPLNCIYAFLVVMEKDQAPITFCGPEVTKGILYSSHTSNIHVLYTTYTPYSHLFKMILSASSCPGLFMKSCILPDPMISWFRHTVLITYKKEHGIPEVFIHLKMHSCIQLHYQSHREKTFVETGCTWAISTEYGYQIRTKLSVNYISSVHQCRDTLRFSTSKDSSIFRTFYSSEHDNFAMPYTKEQIFKSSDYVTLNQETLHCNLRRMTSIFYLYMESAGCAEVLGDEIRNIIADPETAQFPHGISLIGRTEKALIIESKCFKVNDVPRGMSPTFIAKPTTPDHFYKVMVSVGQPTHQLYTSTFNDTYKYFWESLGRASTIKWRTPSQATLFHFIDLGYLHRHCYGRSCHPISVKFEEVQQNNIKSVSAIHDTTTGRCTIYHGGFTGTRRYKVIYRHSWNMAERECNNYGGHLLSINTAEELSAIFRVSQTQPECGGLGKLGISPQVFIGLVSKRQFFHMQRKWTDDSPLKYYSQPPNIQNPTLTENMPGDDSERPFRRRRIKRSYYNKCSSLNGLCGTLMVVYSPNMNTFWQSVVMDKVIKRSIGICEFKPFAKYTTTETQPTQETTGRNLTNTETLTLTTDGYNGTTIDSQNFTPNTNESMGALPTTIQTPENHFKGIDQRKLCPFGYKEIMGHCLCVRTYTSMPSTIIRVCLSAGGYLAQLHQDLINMSSLSLSAELRSYLFKWLVPHRTDYPYHEVFLGDEYGYRDGDRGPCHRLRFLTNLTLSTTRIVQLTQFYDFCTSAEVKSYPLIHVLCEAPNIAQCSDRHGLTACMDGSCIQKVHLCDGFAHCPDLSDEQNCSDLPYQDFTYLSQVTENLVSVGNKTILMSSPMPYHNPLYFMCMTLLHRIPYSHVFDCVKDCPTGDDEEMKPRDFPLGCKLSTVHTCGDGTKVTKEQLCDMLPQCLDTSDETGCYLNSSSNSSDSYEPPIWPCSQPSHIPCYSEPNKCYHQSMVCQVEAPVTCATYSCINTSCGGQYKCKGKDGRCLAVQFLCDGYRHCSLGDDELFCDHLPQSITPNECEGKYRCSTDFDDSSLCISLDKICDNTIHCPSGDDEAAHMCTIPDCLLGCTCHYQAIICNGAPYRYLPQHDWEWKVIIYRSTKIPQYINVSNIYPYRNLLRLDLSWNRITKFNNDFDIQKISQEIMTQPLQELFLRGNNITTIHRHTFALFPHLQILDVQKNPLSTIEQDGFYGLGQLSILHLEYLALNFIAPGAFRGMDSLSYLNLSHNLIWHLTGQEFTNLTNLQVLDLEDNILELIDKDSFVTLESLNTIRTPDHRFCCAVPNHVHCWPPGDEFSSCSDLLDYNHLQVLVWFVGMFAVFGNLMVIINRAKAHAMTPLSLLVQNLGVADLLMGVYLIIIAGASRYYTGVYYLYEIQWRGSVMCRLSGCLSMLSSQMSVYMLTLIAADRVLVLGLNKEGFDDRSARAAAIFGWVLWTLLSVLPVTNLEYFGVNTYIKHGVCFLFNLTEGKVSGWQYATAIFIVHNMCCLCFLAIGYTGTFINLAMKGRLSGNMEARVARKIILVVLTDCICWIPPIAIGILSLQGVRVNPKFAVWVAVFIFPINSALNPFLYTFLAKCSGPKETEDDEADDDDISVVDVDGIVVTDKAKLDKDKKKLKVKKGAYRTVKEKERAERRLSTKKLQRRVTLKEIKHKYPDSENDTKGNNKDFKGKDDDQNSVDSTTFSQEIVRDEPQTSMKLSISVNVCAEMPSSPYCNSEPASRSCSLRMQHVAQVEGHFNIRGTSHEASENIEMVNVTSQK